MIRHSKRRNVSNRSPRRMENEAAMRRHAIRARRFEEDEKGANEENLIEVAKVSQIVDKAVDALSKYGITEIEYEKDQEPPENEAICQDDDGNEVNVVVDEGEAKLSIHLDEENTIEIDLAAPEAEVDESLLEDLEEIFNPEDDEESEAKERRIRRHMERRLNEFKRRRAQKLRVEALRRARMRLEQRTSSAGTLRSSRTRRPSIGNLRRPKDTRR